MPPDTNVKDQPNVSKGHTMKTFLLTAIAATLIATSGFAGDNRYDQLADRIEVVNIEDQRLTDGNVTNGVLTLYTEDMDGDSRRPVVIDLSSLAGADGINGTNGSDGVDGYIPDVTELQASINELQDGQVTALEASSAAAAIAGISLNHNYGSVGIGGAITGRGADILIIDDPIKNREEAESKTIRDKHWNWYTSTAYTRLEKDAAVVLILTRWNIDDLAGRLLKKQEEEWRQGR